MKKKKRTANIGRGRAFWVGLLGDLLGWSIGETLVALLVAGESNRVEKEN